MKQISNGWNIFVGIKGQIAQKKRIKKYVRDVIVHYMPRVMRPIDIEIEVLNKCEKGAYALAWGNRNDVEIELARGTEDKKFHFDEIMLNLAHELIHAKQFLRGDLTANLRWKERKHTLYDQYWASEPWEREAYKDEVLIFENYWKRVDNAS